MGLKQFSIWDLFCIALVFLSGRFKQSFPTFPFPSKIGIEQTMLGHSAIGCSYVSTDASPAGSRST